MKTLKSIGLFVGGFVLGGIVIALWAGQLFSRITTSKQVEVAFQAAQQAEWLAELRLGETEKAIRNMETAMDVAIVSIGQWDEVEPPDEKTRAARDGLLTNVKVYHESYPLKGGDGARVKAMLAAVPGRDPRSICKASICRLDDQRLAKSKAQPERP